MPINRLNISSIPIFSLNLTMDGGLFPIGAAKIAMVALAVEKPEGAQIHLIYDPVIKNRFIAVFLQLQKDLEQKYGDFILYEADKVVIDEIYKMKGVEQDEEINKTDIEEHFDRLVLKGIQVGASDLYLIVNSNIAQVNYRVNKEQIHFKELDMPAAIALQVMRIGYTNGDDDSKAHATFDPTINQSCSITRKISNSMIKIRYQTLVIWPSGVEMICRILKDDNSAVSENISDLKLLGYSGKMSDLIKKAALRPSGLIAIAGPTGSGKSTTLKYAISIINKLRKGKTVIRTIEDPPEYRIPEARQTPVVRKENQANTTESSNPFGDAMAASLRSAFDVMMAGEVRDSKSAEILQQILESGHQVLTTLHAISALGVIKRLEGLGLSREIILSPGFLSALVYQKLAPTPCKHCCKEATDEDLDMYAPFLKNAEARHLIKSYSDEGCSHCNFTGVGGMTVCAEVVVPDDQLIEYLLDGKDMQAKHYWLDTLKGVTAENHGLIKLLKGEISIEGYVATFGAIEESEYYKLSRYVETLL